MENKGELIVGMSSGFPEDVEPSPQSVADVERSPYSAAWHDAVPIELDGHKATGIPEAAKSQQGPKPLGAKWVFTYKTDMYGLFV